MTKTPDPVDPPEQPSAVVAVEPTDTWATLGARLDIDAADLMAANAGPRPLIAGEELTLP